MQFRPCIDIHNGKVKQIVGSSLRDSENHAEENFVSAEDASYFAEIYKKNKIEGAHVILLDKEGTPFYEETRRQAFLALGAYPGHMQAGGGIHEGNAREFLEAGADKVIVTSYVFSGGEVNEDHLKRLRRAVGKEHLALDLSCRRKDGAYIIVTDRWQKDTNVQITEKTLDHFAKYCSEFLIHAVDVEGKSGGIEEDLVRILGAWNRIPITYAGGVHDYDDLEKLYAAGGGRLHVTIGSALDLYGGPMRFEDVLAWCRERGKDTL